MTKPAILYRNGQTFKMIIFDNYDKLAILGKRYNLVWSRSRDLEDCLDSPEFADWDTQAKLHKQYAEVQQEINTLEIAITKLEEILDKEEEKEVAN